MKNVDISRDSDRPARNYRRVVKQQGRVELDADWNEQAAILLRQMRLTALDLIGPHGGPHGSCAFRVLTPADAAGPAGAGKLDAETRELLGHCDTGDFVLTRGRYYVGGLLCEVHRPFLYTAQPDRRHRPLEADERHGYLVYLVVQEQVVTPLEDPGLIEVALGGADTAARVRLAWEVRAVRVEHGEEGRPPKNSTPADLAPTWDEHVAAFDPPQRGALAVRARQQHHDEHDAAAGESRYRGVENQLYRIEIHRGGRVGGASPPTFKWSRDNATAAFAVERCVSEDGQSVVVTLEALGRDPRSTLALGDAVEFDDLAGSAHGLAGVLFSVAAVDLAGRSATLRRAGPFAAGGGAPPRIEIGPDRPMILRRWDHAPRSQRKGGPVVADGAIAIDEGRWQALEDGIEVRFEPAKGKTAHGYRAGDYWLAAARVATGDVDWPRQGGHPEPLAPHGPTRYFAPLALVDVTPTETQRLAQLTRRFGYHRLVDFGRDVFARDGD